MTVKTKADRRSRIKKRIRKVVKGTTERPRLSVFRSNSEIYAQLIDDLEGKTLSHVSSREKEISGKGKITKTEQARLVGEAIAAKAKNAGIESVVFDRGGYLYHGRVKALADAAREGGLKF
ncbi:MAG: 50S ribosomal protein L18 [Flavobacteriales bacterium]|nr:50S ribosomal protein L18 [Flavobacteriales bacterium]MCB9447079.1 50S ribosomal protein L18 [Flavobacteriales bacterium]